MRVIITGSRNWRDVAIIRRELEALPIEETIIVHGAATGADAIAHSVATHLGMTTEPHWPNYVKYPPSQAPLERNRHMVSLGADLVLAFPTAESRGTWACVKVAKAAGIRVKVIKPHE